MSKKISFYSFLWLSGVLAVFSFSAHAQNQRWSFGPRVGANVSKITGDPNSTYKPGLSAGVFLMYSNINHFGISADVLYSQRGGKYDYMTTPVTKEKYTQNLSYIDVPILARYFLTLEGKFRPNLFVGGSANFLLNAKQVSYQINEQDVADRTVTDQLQKFDLGAVVGLGLNFEVSTGKRVLLDLRYQPGLLPIQSASGSSDFRNSTFSVLLSYGFGVGKKY